MDDELLKFLSEVKEVEKQVEAHAGAEEGNGAAAPPKAPPPPAAPPKAPPPAAPPKAPPPVAAPPQAPPPTSAPPSRPPPASQAAAAPKPPPWAVAAAAPAPATSVPRPTIAAAPSKGPSQPAAPQHASGPARPPPPPVLAGAGVPAPGSIPPPPIVAGANPYGDAVARHLANKAAAPIPLAAPAGSTAKLAGPFAAAQAAAAGAGEAARPKAPKVDSKVVHRKAAGETWVDVTLADWPENDFRIFVGDLAPDVTEKDLQQAFQHYASYAMARVVRDKVSKRSRGFGFVSLRDAKEGALALREMNGKYIGNRPCKLRKSTWDERVDKDKTNKKKRKKDLNISTMHASRRRKHIGAFVEASRGLD